MAAARAETIEADLDRRHDPETEYGEAPLMRRLAAEFLGTLLLVAVGAGTVTSFLSGPANRFGALGVGDTPALSGAPQEQVLFTQFFANTFGDLLPVALAFALILAVGIYALGGVSGAHFNPAVTLALAAVRRFSWKEVPVYWIAQILGGIAGAFVLMAIFGDEGAKLVAEVPQVDPATGQPQGSTEVVTNIMFGATTVSDGIERWNAILAEAFITFILMTAIMGVAVDRRAPKGWSGLVIGLALAAGILVTGLVTGGSANFARSLGPFVVSAFNDVKDVPWDDLIVYAAGPIIGAVAAAFVYEGVSGMERVVPAPSPGAATPDPDLLDDLDDDVPEDATRRKTPPPAP
jgi:glycerol uptake facilitator protein